MSDPYLLYLANKNMFKLKKKKKNIIKTKVIPLTPPSGMVTIIKTKVLPPHPPSGMVTIIKTKVLPPPPPSGMVTSANFEYTLTMSGTDEG